MKLLKFTNFVSFIFLLISFFFLYLYTNPSSLLSHNMAENTSKSIYDFTVKVLSFFILFFISSLLSSVFGGWENWFKEKEKLKFDALWCFGHQKVKTPNNLIELCISVWWVMYVFFLVLLENWGLCFTFELVNCVVVYKPSFLFGWVYILFLSWFINLDRKL